MNIDNFKQAILSRKNIEEVNSLIKAVETEYKLGSDSSASGLDPLKVENLSAFMASIIADNQTIKFSKMLKKVPTTSNMYEVPRHLSHGTHYGNFGNFGEQLGLGEYQETNHDRKIYKIKYQVEHREVSIAQSMVDLYHGAGIEQGSGGSINGKAYNQALTIETTSGLQNMAINENRAYWFGNESVDPYSFDGILELHKYQNGSTKLTPVDYHSLPVVFDLRGQRLTYGKLNEINRAIMSKWGAADTFVAPPSVVDNLSSADLVDLRRIIQDGKSDLSGLTVGQEVTRFKSQLGGDINLAWDFHLQQHIEGTADGDNYGDSWKIGDANQKIRTNAPAIPNVTSGTNVAASDALCKFVAADAGDYYYAVAAVGDYGQSKLALINATPVTVQAGYAVDLLWADGAGTYPTRGYIVYRSPKNGASTGYFYPIMTVTAAEKAAGFDGAAVTKVRDRNRQLVGTQTAAMFFNDPRIIHVPELLPTTRIPLARVQLSDKFALAHFYALACPTPSKIAIVKNIGTATPS